MSTCFQPPLLSRRCPIFMKLYYFKSTLRCLIKGHARLLISGYFSILDTLITASPFIKF